MNSTFHYSFLDTSVLYLLLGHKILVFSFQMYIEFVLSFVLGSNLHFYYWLN